MGYARRGSGSSIVELVVLATHARGGTISRRLSTTGDYASFSFEKSDLTSSNVR